MRSRWGKLNRIRCRSLVQSTREHSQSGALGAAAVQMGFFPNAVFGTSAIWIAVAEREPERLLRA